MREGGLGLVAYYRGDDDHSLDRAARLIGDRLAAATGEAPARWRMGGAETTAGMILERVATPPLFGGGTLAVITDPAPLLRSKADREALLGVLGAVAPGNALVFVEHGNGGRRPAALERLEAEVRASGGETREFRAPREGQLAAWLSDWAAERGIRVGPGAARELARRVGGFVREGDVDRRGQAALAVAELDKLSLLRPDAPVSEEDVRALVAEAVPGSTWALLDAVAERSPRVAGPLLDRLLEATPEPVVIVQLHRRVRELIEVGDLLAAGATPGSLVRTLGLKPFRAEKLAGQARRWRLDELEGALEGLLELDAAAKGAPGFASTDRQRRLAFALWVEDWVGGRTSPRAMRDADPPWA